MKGHFMKFFLISGLLVCFASQILFAQSLDRERIKEKQFLIQNEKNKFAKKVKTEQRAKSYPGDPNIDVTYYKLNIRITVPPKPKNLTGSVVIRGKSVISNLTAVSLDLQNTMTVDSIAGPAGNLPFSHASNVILVTLDRTYGQGEDFQLTVHYHGVPGSSGLGSFEFSTQGGQQVVWTLSEPYGAPDWWPCKDNPSDKIDSADILINTHMAYRVGSNGILVDTISNPADTTHTYKWKTRYPIANYLISLAFTNYSESRNYFRYAPTDSMLILNYIYPGSYSSWSTALAKTVGMLEIFSDIYGMYPFINEKYGHCQFGWGGAMEHQTMTSTGTSSEYTIAHELAHQWFGDMITCRDWHHIWINEGFATYSEALYRERKEGGGGYWSEMDNNIYYAKWASGSIYLQDISDPNEIFDWYLTYCKGACVLHMLRHVVGDTNFFNTMKSYALDTTYRFKNASAEDFQTVTENVSGMDLDYFFQEWIYGQNYPDYGMGWVSNPSGNQYELKVRLKQTVNSPSPAFFTMPVDLKITYSGGGDTTVSVFNNQQDQVFTIILNRQPSGVQVDPEEWILRDVFSISFTGVDDPDLTPKSVELYANYPNPFNPGTRIGYFLPESASVRLKVYNTLGQEVRSLFSGRRNAGEHFMNWDGKDASGKFVSSGVYYYRLEADGTARTRKMTLLK